MLWAEHQVLGMHRIQGGCDLYFTSVFNLVEEERQTKTAISDSGGCYEETNTQGNGTES